MTDKTIICEGYFDIPIDQIDTVMAGYAEHVRLSLLESGNRQYDYRPDDTITGRVHVREAYVNQQAFDAHLARTKSSPWPEIRKDVILNIGVKSAD